MSMEQSFRRQATTEAAQWFSTLQQSEVTSAEREQFAQWLSLSARHVEEYLAIAATWRLSAKANAGKFPAVELIAAARAQLGTDRVVRLRRSRMPGRRISKVSLAMTTFAAAIVAIVLTWMLTKPDAIEYQTYGGDRLVASLADGSTVRLNTQTRVRVHLTSKARDIELLTGEALFSVAKNPGRPFRVLSGNNEIRVLGTSFNVQRRGGLTTVTVLEGKVLLDRVADEKEGHPSTQAIHLEPRQQVRVTAKGELVSRRIVEPRAVTAWAQPQLRFSDEPLSKVVDLFNQYNSTRLVLEDDELGTVRVSGVFSSADVDSFVEYLEQAEHMTVLEKDAGIRMIVGR